jgi:hypothetical protein
VKKTSLIASLAVAGLLALPGGALAGNHAPKNDGPKGNAYGKVVKKKVKKKCKNKKGAAKKNCVRKTKPKAYGNIIKEQCGVSFGQLRKKGREEQGKGHVTPSKGAKYFVTNGALDAHCESGQIIVPEEVPEA